MADATPLFLDSRAVARSLPWDELIDALEQAFVAGDATVPRRLHYPLGQAGDAPAMLLLMPAWSERLGIGTKVLSIHPSNAQRGLPSIHALYVLMDAATGRPLAVLDGGELTARRTAAASALASRCLSRADSRCLLMVGTGRLSHHLPLAHARARPIDRVLVWGRSLQKAEATAHALRTEGLEASAAASLPEAVAQADIVSCATLSAEPLVRGDWLRPGTHVDLVGAYTPSMRESDERVFARASSVWCDTLDGAPREGGDIVQAVASGAFSADDIAGDLAALCRRGAAARGAETDITVFKSVGMALEDLAAASLAVMRFNAATNP
ncbi:ornithine cyclodeaminase family protein [Piscinibacter sp. XHJ-5]|uniref:ornithine cyclodeaminase family protein n=1 Tax=Piscinibacter sp. XHJ-5 TaxID=3037797 RepID=UPI002452E6A2|nr:ornithine cyclodeaminase family protein [Piscinibacter sp. XHJ-5]